MCLDVPYRRTPPLRLCRLRNRAQLTADLSCSSWRCDLATPQLELNHCIKKNKSLRQKSVRHAVTPSQCAAPFSRSIFLSFPQSWTLWFKGIRMEREWYARVHQRLASLASHCVASSILNMDRPMHDSADTSEYSFCLLLLRANNVIPALDSAATSSSSGTKWLGARLKKVNPANPSINSNTSSSLSADTTELIEPTGVIL